MLDAKEPLQFRMHEIINNIHYDACHFGIRWESVDNAFVEENFTLSETLILPKFDPLPFFIVERKWFCVFAR